MKVDLRSPTKLAEIFNDYVQTAFAGIPIGEVQLNEMRKAYFAGCHAVLSISAAIGGDEISEDVGVQVLDSMHREVRAFAASLPNNGKGGPTDEEVATSRRN
jgi:hypothetical protein